MFSNLYSATTVLTEIGLIPIPLFQHFACFLAKIASLRGTHTRLYLKDGLEILEVTAHLNLLVCCGCVDCGSGNKGNIVVNGEDGADEVAIYVAVVFHLFICEITEITFRQKQGFYIPFSIQIYVITTVRPTASIGTRIKENKSKRFRPLVAKNLKK